MPGGIGGGRALVDPERRGFLGLHGVQAPGFSAVQVVLARLGALPDPAPGPADYLGARDLLNAYEAALLKLKPKTRRIFLLHRQEGLTYRQIAVAAGISVSGVEKHMMTAIAHIDRALGRP